MLWQFDLSVGSFVKIAQYNLPLLEFAWVTWEPSGTILAVELLNQWGSMCYDNMPYGLVRLDGQSLAVLERIQQVDLTACPPYRFELRHLQLLQSGEMLWCTKGIHILDASTWEYRATLPYWLDGSEHEYRVATASVEWIAVNQENNIVVFNRSTQQGWSLKRQKPFDSR